MRNCVAMVAALALVSGCSDPKKASNANFEKAIQAHLDKQPLCLNAPTSDVRPDTAEPKAFPIYLALPTNPNGQQSFADTARYAEAFVKAGLLRARNGSIPVKDWLSRDPRPTPVRIYELTDAGTAAQPKPDPQDTAATGERAGFCYGTLEVEAVTQFTEPSPAMGVTLSQVNYTYRLKDQAAWTTNAELRAAYPTLARTTGEGMKDQAAVVLTNNGWVDVRDQR